MEIQDECNVMDGEKDRRTPSDTQTGLCRSRGRDWRQYHRLLRLCNLCVRRSPRLDR